MVEAAAGGGFKPANPVGALPSPDLFTTPACDGVTDNAPKDIRMLSPSGSERDDGVAVVVDDVDDELRRARSPWSLSGPEVATEAPKRM